MIVISWCFFIWSLIWITSDWLTSQRIEADGSSVPLDFFCFCGADFLLFCRVPVDWNRLGVFFVLQILLFEQLVGIWLFFFLHFHCGTKCFHVILTYRMDAADLYGAVPFPDRLRWVLLNFMGIFNWLRAMNNVFTGFSWPKPLFCGKKKSTTTVELFWLIPELDWFHPFRSRFQTKKYPEWKVSANICEREKRRWGYCKETVGIVDCQGKQSDPCSFFFTGLFLDFTRF